MTKITIEELRKLAATGAVTLPPVEDDPRAAASECRSGVADADRADRVSELLRAARELARRRSPEQTAELERWLEEREA